MQSVGQKLRHARETQGRTLEQVNSTTRIAVKVLEGIEADDLNCVSSAFLYRSFVKQFAEAVGLDYAELDSSVRSTSDTMPVPLIPGEGSAHPVKIPALRMGRRKSARLMYSVVSFGAVLVACSGIYAVWQNAKLGVPVEWKRMVGAKAGPSKTVGSAAEQKVSDRAGQSGESGLPQVSGASAANANGFTLELSATEPAWLSIVTDGKESFNGILERAETKILEGHRTARVRTGNAGGVEAVFNGKSLGALGARGQVRTVLFTKNDYQVLQPVARIPLIHFTENAGLKLPLDRELLPGL